MGVWKGMIGFFRLHPDWALRLQQNSHDGILVLMIGVCFLYITITILTIVITRKSGMNICILGSIFGVQFIVGVVAVIRLISAGISRDSKSKAKKTGRMAGKGIEARALEDGEEIDL